MPKIESPKTPCGQVLAEQILTYTQNKEAKKLSEAMQYLKCQIERCTGIGQRKIILKAEHNRELGNIMQTRVSTRDKIANIVNILNKDVNETVLFDHLKMYAYVNEVIKDLKRTKSFPI